MEELWILMGCTSCMRLGRTLCMCSNWGVASG